MKLSGAHQHTPAKTSRRPIDIVESPLVLPVIRNSDRRVVPELRSLSELQARSWPQRERKSFRGRYEREPGKTAEFFSCVGKVQARLLNIP